MGDADIIIKQNIKKLTLEKNILQNKIKRLENNLRFQKLSTAGKRVEVAKDVIKQIKHNKFNVATGTWLRMNANNSDLYDWHSLNNDEFRKLEIKEAFENDKITCTGCALGAIMLGVTLFNNNLKVGEQKIYGNVGECAVGKVDPKNGLNNIFTKSQLALIETAFELGRGAFDNEEVTKNDENAEYFVNSSRNVEKAINFGNRYASPKNRLIAIMNNIIKNKGTFKP